MWRRSGWINFIWTYSCIISFGLTPALVSKQMALWNQWLITMQWGENCTLNLAVVLTQCCYEIYGFLHTMRMMRPNKLVKNNFHYLIIYHWGNNHQIGFSEKFRDNNNLTHWKEFGYTQKTKVILRIHLIYIRILCMWHLVIQDSW